MVQFIFRTFPVLLFPFPHSIPSFSKKSVFSGARESCLRYLAGTHLSAYTSNPSRWASVLNSEVKTHYRAISPLVMLSNDLISLSVGPVTQQRPCQHGLPCPRVPAALGASPPLPLHAPQLGPSSSKTG